MLLFATLLAIAATPAGSSTLIIDRAEFTATSADALPHVTPEAWSPVTLPDRWRDRRPALGGPGWYRFTFQLEESPPCLWSIYLPDVNMNAAVYLNGAMVGVEGAMDGALGNNWNRPLLFNIPSPMLRRGSNEVMIELQAQAYAFGGLGPVFLGPTSSLTAVFDWRRFYAVSMAQIAAHIAAWLFAWAVALWLWTRREPLFGWFALAMLGFVIANLNFFVRDLPVSRGTWEWAVNLTPNLYGVASLAFLHRLVGWQRPSLERVFILALVVGAAATAIVPARLFYATTHVVYVVGVTAALCCVWTVFRGRGQMSLFEALAMRSACLGAALFGSHDLLIQVGVLGQGSIRLLPHASSMCVLMLGSVVVARLVTALEAGRRHNAELRKAVQDREADLAAQFARVRTFERSQLVMVERERLMRELHDGLGGHLASTLAMADGPSFAREDVIESVHLISEELSLLVDALDPTLDDLPSILAILRSRLEPRLVRAGLRFDWQVGDVAFERRLPPDHLHHLMRIVQEAIANIIKHARARTITVRTDLEREAYVLEIHDDGAGLGPLREGGRGLRNMQYRAHQLGAVLTVTAASPGVIVALRLPRGNVGPGDEGSAHALSHPSESSPC